MDDPLQSLYQTRSYPAMSHPSSDPAVTTIAAALGGLTTPPPSSARILEIGCGSGHNLIPLALRWPGSEFLGIDLSHRAVATARELATLAGSSNIEFQVADLREFEATGGGFDFIIAHGFLSWVPDDAKQALFACCRRNLTNHGIATISYNVAAGWEPRFAVVRQVLAIQQATACSTCDALAALRPLARNQPAQSAIIDDMLAKGPDILAFDDFGPVNDPWSFSRFIHTAASHHLRYLGESVPAANHHPSLAPATLAELQQQFAPRPLELLDAIDTATQRTFRSAVLCHQAAHLLPNPLVSQILRWAWRIGPHQPSNPCDEVFQAVVSTTPSCLRLSDLIQLFHVSDARSWARQALAGLAHGSLEARFQAVVFNPAVPPRPVLNPFRAECARRHLPLVDIWHRPCAFPDPHYHVLAALDGTRDEAAIAELARRACPELAVPAWLRHLAERGMFEP